MDIGKNFRAMERHSSIIKRINDYFFPKEEEWTGWEKILAVGFWGLPLWLTLLLYPFVNNCSGNESSLDNHQINRGTYNLQEASETTPEFKPLPDAAERFEKMLQEGTKGYNEDVYDILDQYLD